MIWYAISGTNKAYGAIERPSTQYAHVPMHSTRGDSLYALNAHTVTAHSHARTARAPCALKNASVQQHSISSSWSIQNSTENAPLPFGLLYPEHCKTSMPPLSLMTIVTPLYAILHWQRTPPPDTLKSAQYKEAYAWSYMWKIW